MAWYLGLPGSIPHMARRIVIFGANMTPPLKELELVKDHTDAWPPFLSGIIGENVAKVHKNITVRTQ